METNKIKWDRTMAERCLMKWNIATSNKDTLRVTNDVTEDFQWEEFKKELDKVLG